MRTLPPSQLALLPAHNILHEQDAFEARIINDKLSVIISKTVKAPFAFDSLVLSVSARLAAGGALLAQAAVQTDEGWSGFYKLFYISHGYKKTFAPQRDKFASVDTDILTPRGPARRFKYKITLLGRAEISLICAALTRAGARYDRALAVETLGLRDRILPLRPVPSARLKDKKLAARVCSPAALTAVLNYMGKKIKLSQAVKGVYDEGAKIYGAWPLNTAFAAQQGLGAVFMRCASLAQAEGEVLRGRPLIVSLAYKEGGLKNAPVRATAGHLVVIAGFDAAGNIVAADSAAHTPALRIYDRAQFARAWLGNKRGAAYAIAPLKNRLD
ncbi:MAG: C39 family peptidase [Elusimicrobiota bacterium]|jgi:hypothetical protein|nr:C39 family peptidase [Elusimicrobiota bacterium]